MRALPDNMSDSHTVAAMLRMANDYDMLADTTSQFRQFYRQLGVREVRRTRNIWQRRRSSGEAEWKRLKAHF
jgi:hypothetical protein